MAAGAMAEAPPTTSDVHEASNLAALGGAADAPNLPSADNALNGCEAAPSTLPTTNLPGGGAQLPAWASNTYNDGYE